MATRQDHFLSPVCHSFFFVCLHSQLVIQSHKSFCLSLYITIYHPGSLQISKGFLCVYLSRDLCTRLVICLSFCLSFLLTVFHSLCLCSCSCFCLSVTVFVSKCVCLSLSLSLTLSLCLSLSCQDVGAAYSCPTTALSS